MSKHVTLQQAVRAAVTPGATVHFSLSQHRSHAAAFEVARQFRDSHSLALVGTGMLEYAAVLWAAGAIGRIESAFAGNTFPAPSPSPVLAMALGTDDPHDPHWTNLSMTLRLMAGALGWPFVPVHGLTGTDLAKGAGRANLPNPFGEGNVQLASALVPDVAFVHGAVADTAGNVFVPQPWAEELWGAWAARTVVVTAEVVVSREEYRRMGPRPGLPAHRVRYVCEAPYGAHPQALFVRTGDAIRPYAEDSAMRLELRRLGRDPKALRQWVETWIFAGDHAAYLERVGLDRLLTLREIAEAPPPAIPPDETLPVTPAERAAVLAMRQAVACVEGGTHDVIFAGLGLSHIAAWAAEAWCRERGRDVTLAAETGLVGFRPREGDPYLFNAANIADSLFHSGFVRLLGALAGPRATRCLAMLGAAEIDKSGAINSTRTEHGRFIVGSGGANDLASGACDTVVVMPAASGRLRDHVAFATSRTRHLLSVATDSGVLERNVVSGELELATVMADPPDASATIDALKGVCGWPLRVRSNIQLVSPPSRAEIARLRTFDPQRQLLG